MGDTPRTLHVFFIKPETSKNYIEYAGILESASEDPGEWLRAAKAKYGIKSDLLVSEMRHLKPLPEKIYRFGSYIGDNDGSFKLSTYEKPE